MSDELGSRVKDDFFHARFKAFLNGVQAAPGLLSDAGWRDDGG